VVRTLRTLWTTGPIATGLSSVPPTAAVSTRLGLVVGGLPLCGVGCGAGAGAWDAKTGAPLWMLPAYDGGSLTSAVYADNATAGVPVLYAMAVNVSTSTASVVPFAVTRNGVAAGGEGCFIIQSSPVTACCKCSRLRYGNAGARRKRFPACRGGCVGSQPVLHTAAVRASLRGSARWQCGPGTAHNPGKRAPPTSAIVTRVYW
jgi:hypothetical protein